VWRCLFYHIREGCVNLIVFLNNVFWSVILFHSGWNEKNTEFFWVLFLRLFISSVPYTINNDVLLKNWMDAILILLGILSNVHNECTRDVETWRNHLLRTLLLNIRFISLVIQLSRVGVLLYKNVKNQGRMQQL
jgi:hypothetical protein